MGLFERFKRPRTPQGLSPEKLAAVPPPGSWQEAAPRLFPAVRTAGWVAEAVGEAKPITEPFLPFLHSLIAIDGGSYVTRDDLARWGVAPDLARATAVSNLSHSEVPFSQPVPNIPAVDVLGPGGYASSWLTAGRTLARAAGENSSSLVVLAPSRDQLRLVATPDRWLLLQELEQALEVYQQSPRQLSPVPYALDGERVVPWDPPPAHPCRAIVGRAKGILAGVEYTRQQAALRSLFEAVGDEMFVGRYALIDREDGTVASYTVWPQDVPAGLLPEADYLVLRAGSGEYLWVRWEDAADVAPEALRRERGYWPPRWRVGRWPDKAALERLRSVADPTLG